MNKVIQEIPANVMDIMVAHSWPGNIRELQNFVERSVILTNGQVLSLPFGRPTRFNKAQVKEPITLEEAERNHICKTLMQTKGVISGANGAAVRLGVKRSTLYFRMRKLGISRSIVTIGAE